MRLEGIAKAGFYPTPPHTLQLIARLLAATALAGQLRGRAALDPCAGEGEALAVISQVLGMKSYGIELDNERAQVARKKLYKVQQGDALCHTAHNFDLLWLNPPYDYGPDGERLEKSFLKRYGEALAVGGIMVLLVPEHTLPALWPVLTAGHLPLLVARLPEREYEVFKQVAVIAQRVYARKAQPGDWVAQTLPYLDQVKSLELVQTTLLIGQPRLVADLVLQPEAALEAAEKSPLWTALQRDVVPRVEPLLPLKPPHLALLIAGGVLDLEKVEIEGVPHLILGVLKKDTVGIESEDGRIEREVFRMGIKALNLDNYELLEVS